MKRRFFIAGVVVLLAGAGCGPPKDQLSGSVREELTLTFDQVRAEWIVDDFILRYLNGVGRGATEPVRLTIPRAAIDGATEIPIEKVRVEHFVAVHHADGSVTEEPSFPLAESGWVRPETLGTKPGDPARGSFSVHFEGGRTLGGEFDLAVTTP
jgi:hypothetical protein